MDIRSKDLNGKKFLHGNTKCSPIGYKIGDEIVFEVSLYCGDKICTCPKLFWEIKRDFYNSEKGCESGESGAITVKTSLDRPGLVSLVVYAADEDGNELNDVKRFEGGAVVELKNITQSSAEPDDFDDFWDAELQIIKNVEPKLISSVEIESEDPDFRVYDIRIASFDTPVSAILSMPKNAEAGSLSVKMIYNGYGTLFLDPEYNKGFATLNVNSHSIENRAEDAYYTALKQNEIKGFGFYASDYEDPSRAKFCAMILRDLQALKYMKTIPEWNGKTVISSGGSMGGFQATAVAALDRDVTKLEAHIIWMCDVGARRSGRIAGWLPEYCENLNYFDTVNFAKRIKCPVYIDGMGLGDYVACPSGIIAMYNSLSTEKSMLLIQNALHDINPCIREEYLIEN